MAATPDNKANFLQCALVVFQDFLALMKEPVEATTNKKRRQSIFELVARMKSLQTEFEMNAFLYTAQPGMEFSHGIGYFFSRYAGLPRQPMLSGKDFWQELLSTMYQIQKFPLSEALEERTSSEAYYQKHMQNFTMLMYYERITFFMAVIENDLLHYFIFSQDGTIAYSSRSILESLFSREDVEFLHILFLKKDPPHS